MAWAARIEKLIPDLSAAILRFPVPALCSVLLCIWLNAEGWASDREGRVVAAFVAAFMASGAMQLNAEARGLRRAASLLLSVAVAVVFWFVAFLGPAVDANPLFLLFGLLPVLMIAPALRAGGEQGAIWLFNLRLGLAALIAFVVALLFALGLSAIVGAMDVLFSVNVGSAHEHIWFTASSLIGPLYGLSLMPRKLDEVVDISPQRGSLLDRGISVLVNYVAVPVIAAYALILHAYAVKILVEGELPKGQIGTMVSIFAIGGTATWLVAWPWREAGTRLLRLFMSTWFFLLIVPGILLSIAIWRRIVDYGVTPDRYGVVLVAVWVAALVIYLALRRNRADMRAILGAAAVLMLIGSAGPWGANGLTVSSQFARLVNLLEANGVLKDGKITLSGLLPPAAQNEGASILYALQSVDGLDRLKPWFSGQNDSFWASDDWYVVAQLGERLGIQPPNNDLTAVSFSANTVGGFLVPPGGTLYGPLDARVVFGDAAGVPSLSALFAGDDLIIRLPDSTMRIPITDIIDAARSARATARQDLPPLRLERDGGVLLIVEQVYGNTASPAPLSTGRFWIILPPPP